MKKGKIVVCQICHRTFYKAPSEIRESNLCSIECRNKWLSQRNVEIMNVTGHSEGHKAPHLTELNCLRNPFCSISNKVFEVNDINSKKYRSIVEKHIGRKLVSNEVVHHINGIKTDNRIENLMIMSNAEHHRLHMKIACKKFNLGGENGDDGKCQKMKPYQKE